MKIQLFTNGFLKGETQIPYYDYEKNRYKSWRQNVEYREDRMEKYVACIKADFFRQLARAKNWEVYIVAESRLNEDIEKYTAELGGEKVLENEKNYKT